MKMKAVCEATGLTDRAVRYYIDEGLLEPNYTENYLGRRNYDFTDDDIRALERIATLRKYDFSVAEIKRMLAEPESIDEICSGLISRKRQKLDEDAAILEALEKLPEAKPENVEELVSALKKPSDPLPAPDRDAKLSSPRSVLKLIHRIILFIHALAPVAAAVLIFIDNMAHWRFPVFSALCIVLTLVFLSPSVLMLILIIVKKLSLWKRAACIVLCVLVFLSLLPVAVCSVGIVSRSETHDPLNYLELNERRTTSYNEYLTYRFFSTDTHFYHIVGGERVSHGKYLYRDLRAWDYTYDIYAEWPDSVGEIESEILRITELFEAEASKRNYWKLTNARKGSYECMILYCGEEPFTEVTDNYTYYIFAYDLSAHLVRYILCVSEENGVDQPYYLELDW